MRFLKKWGLRLPRRYRLPAGTYWVVLYLPGAASQMQELAALPRRGRSAARSIALAWAACAFPLILAIIAARIAAAGLWQMGLVFLCMPGLLLGCALLLCKRTQDLTLSALLALTSICANLWGFASAVSYGNLSCADAARLAVEQGITASAGVLNWCFVFALSLIHAAFAVHRTARFVKRRWRAHRQAARWNAG